MKPKYTPPFQGKEAILPQDLTQHVLWFNTVEEIQNLFARIADMSAYCDLIGLPSHDGRAYDDEDSFDVRSRSAWATQILKHQKKWGRVIGVPTKNLSPGMVYYDKGLGEYLIVEEVSTDLDKPEQPQPVDWFSVSREQYQEFLRLHERYQKSLNGYVVRGRIYRGDQERAVKLHHSTQWPSTTLVFLDPPALSTVAEGIEVGAEYWKLSNNSAIGTIKQFHCVEGKVWVVLAIKGEYSTDLSYVRYERISLEKLKSLRFYKPYWGQLAEKPFGFGGMLNGFDLYVSGTFEKRKVELSFSTGSSWNDKLIFAEVLQNRDQTTPDWHQPRIGWGHTDANDDDRRREALYYDKSLSFMSIDTADRFTAMLGQILKISQNIESFFDQITRDEPDIEGVSDLETATPSN